MDIQEFYEGLNMKVEQQIPLLLVERQALNEAMEAEKIVSDMLAIILHFTLHMLNIIFLPSLIRDTTLLKQGVSAYRKSRLSEL